MAKKFKGRTNPLSELHFIADISLEQAVMLVGDLADDIHIVTITEIDSDSFKFEVNDSRQQSRHTEINGTLQRWQGTETRVDCSGVVSMVNTTSNRLVLRMSPWIIALLVFLGLATEPIDKQSIALLITFVSVTLGLMTFMMVSDGSSGEDLLFRDRDRLLQLIINTFKSAGNIEAYNPTQVKLNADTASYIGDDAKKISTSGR